MFLFSATPSSVYSALREFGYDSFRPGQEAAVMRVLSGGWTTVNMCNVMVPLPTHKNVNFDQLAKVSFSCI